MNKKTLFFSFIFLLLSYNFFSLSLSLEPKIQYENFCISDYLYGVTGKLNSRIDYKSKYSLKAGSSLEFGVGQFFFSVSGMFYVPMQCGKMTDSDWKTENIKTDFSIHDLFIEKGMDFSVEAKYKFKILEHFNLAPIFSADYSYIDLSAKSGTAYKASKGTTGLDTDYSWDSEYAVKKRVYGIDFFNYSLLVFSGLQFYYEVPNFFSIFQIELSPFSYFFSVDHHLGKTSGQYYQMIQKDSFNVYRFTLENGFFITKRQLIQIGINITFSKEIKGDSYFGYYAIEHIKADEKSAFKFSKANCSLSYKFFFIR